MALANQALAEPALHAWVTEQLQAHPTLQLLGDIQLSPLSGDAGARTYYRVVGELAGSMVGGGAPIVLAVAAPIDAGASDSAEGFSRLAQPLKQAGIEVPDIIAVDPANNWMLVESFGADSLLSQLKDDSVDILYGEALMSLLGWQQVTPGDLSDIALPSYDHAALASELSLFSVWFVEQLLGYSPNAKERQLLDDTFGFLIDQALAQPRVLVHRDYHSRNLMYSTGKPLGIIDFQDALWGPITYDVVSLLRDCYVRWSPEQVSRWALAYGNMAMDVGVLPVTSRQQYLRWFDTMGLQRHIKVLGVFARLWLRDGKARYLNDLPLVLRYTLDIAQNYSETRPLALWIRQQLLPLIKQQPWFKPLDSVGDREVNV